jgi:glutathione S-transferase
MTIGHIAIACALGWSLFALPNDAWWRRNPRLAKWHEQFEQRPSMVATRFETLKRSLPPGMIKEGPASTPLSNSERS